MLKYILKRLLLAIPTLLLLSIIAFFLSSLAPGDPVMERLLRGESEERLNVDPAGFRHAYQRIAGEMRMDLPLFFFSISRASMPDTLHRLYPQEERGAVKECIHVHGHWPELQQLRQEIFQLENLVRNQSGNGRLILNELAFLRTAGNERRAMRHLDQLAQLSEVDPQIRSEIEGLRDAYSAYFQLKPGVAAYFPAFQWHGADNRFYAWLKGAAAWDFGISKVDGRPVGTKITEALRWTLAINIPVILLSFLLAIPLGVAAARRLGSAFDKVSSTTLFALYAMPSFWVATLFVVFLTTPAYAEWLDLFPSQGLGNYRYASSSWSRIWIIAYHLVLPVLSLTLGTMAYLFKQMKQSMIHEMEQEYIFFARAKGVGERSLYWKHAFRNALNPIITILGGVVPATISGSVIIEVIFNIPGMGRLLYFSIFNKDWNVVFAMLLLAGILTVVGYLLADILYSMTDPRIKLIKQRGRT